MKSPRLLIYILAISLALSGNILGQDMYREFPVGLTPVHVRVTWTSNPQTTAVVSWSTGDQGAAHSVYYSTESITEIDEDSSVRKLDAFRNGLFSLSEEAALSVYEKEVEAHPEITLEQIKENFTGFYYHHALLAGLKPDTRYYIKVVSDGHESREFYFRTAPDRDIPFKVIAGGDSRSGLEDRLRVNHLIAKLVENDDSILAFLHGGDYVALGPSDLTQWNNWLYDLEETRTENGRILPIIPTRGNHENTGNLYDEVFCWPGNEMNIFTTCLSPSVFLITLNTNLETGGDQRVFLEKALEESKNIRWQLVQYHQPAYPAVKGPGPALQNWVPLFEKYKVPLVLESDGHTLKRTVPIMNGQHVEGGVVYVGEGGLGVKQRTPKLDRWYIQPPGMATSAHHVQVLSFSEEELSYKAIGLGESVLDSYVVKR